MPPPLLLPQVFECFMIRFVLYTQGLSYPKKFSLEINGSLLHPCTGILCTECSPCVPMYRHPMSRACSEMRRVTAQRLQESDLSCVKIPSRFELCDERTARQLPVDPARICGEVLQRKPGIETNNSRARWICKYVVISLVSSERH